MSRNEEEQFEQDRLGNVNRKLDTLRAQEGNAGSDSDDEGIQRISGSGEVGTDLLLMSKPTHADELIVTKVYLHNSNPSGGDTATLKEAILDSSNNIQSTTRRSVPLQVGSAQTSVYDYEGRPFQSAIAVESEFQGVVAVSVVSDHKEESEPGSETRNTP